MKYEKPEWEVMFFEAKDVVTASQNGPGTDYGDWN